MGAPILDRIKSSKGLPSLPTVAMEILRLIQSDDVSVGQIASLVQQDPALTSKLLRMVNSPLFGMTREVASVQQAMVVLGLRTVKVLVLSFSLVDVLQEDKSGAFDYETYWRRSLTTAAAARLIAKNVTPRLAEEAFVSGLLADLGMLGAWRCARDLYQPVLDAWGPRDRTLPEIERDMLGVSHAGMSRQLLITWGLPATLCDAVGAHHGEGLQELEGPPRELGIVTFAAALVSALFCGDIPQHRLDEVRKQILNVTRIPPNALESILKDLDGHVCQTASLLSLQVGQTVNYAELQTQAAMQLARLSMQAEVERAASSRREEEARITVNQLQEEKRAILEIASTDGLTRIANRSAFDKRLAEETDRARARQYPLGLILMDVDHFKQFNDTHGHQAGDAILQQIAAWLTDVTRSIGFAARYGGEEFAVILANETAKDIASLAEEIRRTIAAGVVRYDGRELKVTASFGAARLQDHRDALTPQRLIAEADQLLYLAKRNGRNRVETVT